MSEGKPQVSVNGERQPLSAELLEELLRELGYDLSRRGIAVAVNGRVIRRVSWPAHRLRAGDEIDVVGAVQGG